MRRRIPDDVENFVKRYEPSHLGRIDFDWNGKHTNEFEDRNQDFRGEVTSYVVENPGAASVHLLQDLLAAYARWSREAWCAPHDYARVAALLLERGGPDVLPSFASSFAATFDTFCACHEMELAPVTIRSLRFRCQEILSTELSEDDRRQWESMQELFEQLAAGTAHHGLVQIEPGTEVIVQ